MTDEGRSAPTDPGLLYPALLEAVHDYAIYALDAQGRVLSWNSGAERMKGWRERDVIGRDVSTFYPPDEVAAGLPRAHLTDAARVGRSEEEGWRVRKDGSRFWASVITTPLRGADGTVTGFAKVTRDLTHRRAAEAAVRESEQRFRRAFEDAAIGMSITGADGRWIRVNQALCRMLGYSREEMLAADFQAVTHPDDLAASTSLMYEALAGASDHLSIEKRYVHRDGHDVWVYLDIVVIRDDPDLDPYFLVQTQDISEHRQAQHALATSELKFRSLSVCSPVGIFQSDAAGRITYANPRLLSIFDVTEDEGLGYGWLERVHPDDRDAVMSGWAAALAARQEYSHEYRLLLRDGGTRWVRCHAAFLDDVDGRPGTVGTVHDVTDRFVLEAQLRQAQKLEAVGRLAGGIAHDFNNLLTVISGNAAFARGSLPHDSAAWRDLEQVETAAARAADLTRQLLAFSRQQVLQPRQVDVNDTVREVSSMLARVIGDVVRVRMSLCPEACWVNVDPGQLQQVLMNLVTNARDAMPDGGAIDIVTGRRTLERRSVDTDGELAPGSYVFLTVRDEGIGIDPEALAHVFDPFYTTKDVGRGTGLGLATVYGIVAQSGGRIRAESTLGQGSCFTVLLPCAVDGEPALPPAEAERPHSVVGRILLAEDNPAVSDIVARMLTSAGYDVARAGDGMEALEMLEAARGRDAAAGESPFDLVLADLEMPRLGGAALVTRLRSEWPGVSAVLMTGYTRITECPRLGGRDVDLLRKPFTRADLLDQVRRTLLERTGMQSTP